MIKGLM